MENEEFLLILKTLYFWPIVRNHTTNKKLDKFFKEALEDEKFEIFWCDDYHARFRTSQGEFETWIANANYACCDGHNTHKLGKFGSVGEGMPSRWVVKEFMKEVKKFKKGEKSACAN